MDIEKIINEMTFEEKAYLLKGASNMSTYHLDRFGVDALTFADGPHGVRLSSEKNCTHFPSLCNLGSSWDVKAAKAMGKALAYDCINNGIGMLLGPGMNIKRHILCGRNFEYLSEDPVLSGEIAAGYIEGLQENGVSACPKHFAVNNQEEYRISTSVEIDERTLREIYLKGFEIAVKKSKPDCIMTAYNKVNAVWCSENEMLINGILKGDWKYEGLVVSDWCAVHDISRSIKAGLDLQMPGNPEIVEQLTEGLEKGIVTMEQIDGAVRNMLKFLDIEPVQKIGYDRIKQHETAKEIASAGIVLLKNNDAVLPLTEEKYKKIAVVGEFAVSPLIGGQGSADVLQGEEYTDIPYEELKKLLPNTEFKYIEMYKKAEFSEKMLWPKYIEFKENIADCDLVLYFAGSMVSEDTENFDRRTAYLNPNYELFMRYAVEMGKKTAVVLQNGGALIFGQWLKKTDAVLEMWLAGEAGGRAVAEVLCGIVNPSGKLSETFPNTMRSDLEYPGNGLLVEYKERFNVGYRYYDKHPEEILYPFGHGLSYTKFEYSNLVISNEDMSVEMTIKNVGDYDGAEVVQLYIGDPLATVVRPVKELKKFEKIFLARGEEKQIRFVLAYDDFAYYNVSLRKWTVENGVYDVYIGSSSRDIRLKGSLYYQSEMEYSIEQTGEAMIG